MKKYITFALTLLLLLSLSACGNSNDITKLQNEIAELKQENQELRNQIEILQSGGTIGDNTNTDDTQSNDTDVKSVKIGETFSVGEVMEITLNSSEWCDEILPSNTSGGYSYLKNVNGEKFFVVKGTIKNLSGESFDIQYASNADVLINGKYKASATLKAEEADGKSFYGNVKPLQTLNLIIYSSVSDDLYNSCENAVLTMNIVKDESKLNNFYNDDTSHDTFTISFSK